MSVLSTNLIATPAAAFAIWLLVRIVNRRERWAIRTAIALVLATAGCWLIAANIRPGQPILLGHVSSDEPPIRPGLWIHGNEFGWPWRYRTESFKTDAIRIAVFDRFEWLPLAG